MGGKQNFFLFNRKRLSLKKLKAKTIKSQKLKNSKRKFENLSSSKRTFDKVYPLVKEVHFAIGEKKLYAIGFENLSGGWELRNSFYKGSLLKKDISVVNFNNNLEKKKCSRF